ncbi:MAG: TIGR00266 family protein [Candidatus Obscuribacterales bacterium]|uniref:TIGR00266 family protein n=1 Tax=Candidatus Obscuribacter phosphatis TaxID=1906157 RepID=A0A8J7P9Z8_9BACT|nr:TIGR00266 family protein [Candidatus Obscuribacter phosphatis]MBX9941121.1 TIGR00266 family protein [Candidatus Obscuribacterales bacterium]
MEYQLLHEGSNAVLKVCLQPGEHIKAESGAMVAKTGHLVIEGKMWGGAMNALKRSVLGGETFFFQEVSATEGAGEVLLAPSPPGDVKVIHISGGQDYFVKSGCMLAAMDQIEMDTKAQKLTSGLFSGAGLFVLHLKGNGGFAVSAFGAIMEIDIPPGEKYMVDNGHLVAWSGDTSYEIVKAGKNWVSSFTSGEGLGCMFTGPGRVYIQTRNPEAFGAWVRRFVPTTSG